MLKLVFQYIRYYKKQTFAILASVFLTSALITGIGSLMYSSAMNDLENKRTMYGDWHYCISVNEKTYEDITAGIQGNGYAVSALGKAEIKGYLTTHYKICLLDADDEYLRMTHRDLKKGSYPTASNEIAADIYTLNNLGFTGDIGDTLQLNGKSYILTGILKSSWSENTDKMDIFVGRNYVGSESHPLLYIKFDETEALYKQLDSFQWDYKINSDAITPNEEVVKYLNGEKPERITDIIRFGLTNEYGNLTYIILTLQNEYNLSFYSMIILLSLFGTMVIYSVFNISISRRRAEYAVMQTLGISEGTVACLMYIELLILYVIGYPAGTLSAAAALRYWYRYTQNSSGLFISCKAVIIGFIFLMTALIYISFSAIRGMRGLTLRQIMSGDNSHTSHIRRIYSRGRANLLSIINRRFIFSGKRRTFGILLSLSIGGCLFLCTSYLTENLKIHAEMSMKSDDGLNSTYKISLISNDLSDTISPEVVEDIKAIKELEDVYAVRFTVGEIRINESELKWKEFFDEQNKHEYFNQRFGGILTKNEDRTYSIKYDIYGYDDKELEILKDYVLEGSIDAEELSEGKIVLVALMDGQGNYNSYGKHPGDKIRLKTLDEHSEEKEYEIAAIVSRALSQESGFLNDGAWRNMQSVIFTNDRMEREFGITDYSFINASLSDGADSDTTVKNILSIIQDTPKAVLHDYTTAIETQKNYLHQQQIFFSAISVILLAISLFHIMNSMNYTILSRKREYGILRAIGITDRAYFITILKMGLIYGVLSDICIFLIYNLLLRRFMDYYMAHVVKFLHFTATVPSSFVIGIGALNILIALIAVYIPARKIIRENVCAQI
ncbi:MAG: FtsX-like permease family protein [Eubacterium sp.]|nr:FtsX-like permease family protein [Eubacterium sp.]